MALLLAALGLTHKNTATVLGHLELLWHFTAEFAPRGDIGKYQDAQIEGALHWYGRPGRLIEALTTSGWIERNRVHRLVVHDWHDHAEQSVLKRIQRNNTTFLSLAEKMTGQNPSMDSLPSPSPMPSPHAPALSGGVACNPSGNTTSNGVASERSPRAAPAARGGLSAFDYDRAMKAVKPKAVKS